MLQIEQNYALFCLELKSLCLFDLQFANLQLTICNNHNAWQIALTIKPISFPFFSPLGRLVSDW